jgi:hypothetical protein
MLQNRKVYESNLEAQLAQWKADIDVLKAKAKRAEVGAQIQYDKTIDSLQRTHDDAGKQLHSLKVAGDEAWDSVKTGTEKAWTEFRDLFRDSHSKH